ncbi:hypothetical protein [Streptomyces avermitilis]|uniref:hypothetical protein n=1 Tax=Streptomyces avermitilis TaxID=33903 RepID=UPI00367A8756
MPGRPAKTPSGNEETRSPTDRQGQVVSAPRSSPTPTPSSYQSAPTRSVPVRGVE